MATNNTSRCWIIPHRHGCCIGYCCICLGVNEGLRKKDHISVEISDEKKWKSYVKGGPFNNWFGNMWLVVDYSKDGYNFLLKSVSINRIRNEL